MPFSALLKGFMVGFGLIVAIGPQNAFVISQGVRRSHLFLTAIVCVLIDAVLFSLGVVGVGDLFVSHPQALSVFRWVGVVFLVGYGCYALRLAFKPQILASDDIDLSKRTVKQTLLLLLGFGFLNPHAYLDTLVLAGSVAVEQLGMARYVFGLGLILASAVWFFALAYGASSLSHLFKKPMAWRVLNTLTCLAMWLVAASLLAN